MRRSPSVRGPTRRVIAPHECELERPLRPLTRLERDQPASFVEAELKDIILVPEDTPTLPGTPKPFEQSGHRHVIGVCIGNA
jgi:hypothetical protein